MASSQEAGRNRMITPEQNRKLAEWAGFKFYQPIEEGAIDVIDPEGSAYLSPSKLAIPDFYNDLNACFRWLVPNFPSGIRLMMLGQLRNDKGYFCSIGGGYLAYYYTESYKPAEALCLAILKMIGET